jgi:hypothetical protein
MGTHAMIGVWNSETGEVTASYVHYDGYVEGVGRTLVNSYNTVELAEVVASGGYLSSLEDDYSASRADSVHRDPAPRYSSIEEYMNDGYDYGAEYIYLWDGEAWFYAHRDGRTTFEEVQMNLRAN